MRIIRDVWQCPEDARGAVVALGNFDGMHRGHQHILKQCMEQARALGAAPAVLTFEPHPRMYFKPGTPSLRIQSFYQKARWLQEHGIYTLYAARFNRALSATPATAFVEDLLVRALGVCHLVVGDNFMFGKDRGGDLALLQDLAQKHDFGLTPVRAILDEAGHAYSSSRVREALEQGNIEAANRLLGHPYTISGHVQRGNQLGRQLGAATANLHLSGILKPRYGVYAARVQIGSEKLLRDAVCNLGLRPTFGGSQPLLEVHVLDAAPELYGARICVQPVRFLRSEQKFATPEALRAQIGQDITQAKECLRHADSL